MGTGHDIFQALYPLWSTVKLSV